MTLNPWSMSFHCRFDVALAARPKAQGEKMQSTEAGSVLGGTDISARKSFAYYRWMAGEGIPIHSEVAAVADITQLPRKPWARTGKGLGAFFELIGTFQAERGMFVCEIPPGEALDVQHHLYEQFTLILQGRGILCLKPSKRQEPRGCWPPGGSHVRSRRSRDICLRRLRSGAGGPGYVRSGGS